MIFNLKYCIQTHTVQTSIKDFQAQSRLGQVRLCQVSHQSSSVSQRSIFIIKIFCQVKILDKNFGHQIEMVAYLSLSFSLFLSHYLSLPPPVTLSIFLFLSHYLSLPPPVTLSISLSLSPSLLLSLPLSLSQSLSPPNLSLSFFLSHSHTHIFKMDFHQSKTVQL